jgi:hypothetical protein
MDGNHFLLKTVWSIHVILQVEAIIVHFPEQFARIYVGKCILRSWVMGNPFY